MDEQSYRHQRADVLVRDWCQQVMSMSIDPQYATEEHRSSAYTNSGHILHLPVTILLLLKYSVYTKIPAINCLLKYI